MNDLAKLLERRLKDGQLFEVVRNHLDDVDLTPHELDIIQMRLGLQGEAKSCMAKFVDISAVPFGEGKVIVFALDADGRVWAHTANADGRACWVRYTSDRMHPRTGAIVEGEPR